MKRLLSEVKAASEKQQTNTHHRGNEGERWRRRKGCVCVGGADSEEHLAEDNLITGRQHSYARGAALKSMMLL